jgi:hypothetical protein
VNLPSSGRLLGECRLSVRVAANPTGGRNMRKLLLLCAFTGLVGCTETAPPPPQTTTENSQETAFMGDWRTVQTCPNRSQTNILRVRTATPSQVLGTTTVGENSGDIVSGTVNGRDVTFVIKYVATWDKGQTYTEVWTGRMSADGMTISGNYTSNNPNDPSCAFAGARM